MLASFAAFLALYAPSARGFDPADVSASSTAPPADGTRYTALHVSDDRVGTVWMEGDRGSGLGASVTLTFGQPTAVRGLRIWNGNWYSGDLWARYNRMKDVEVQLSDGSKHSFTLQDAHVPEMLLFPAPVTTTSLRVRFKSVYGGSTFGDTVVSEIQVLDAAPPAHVPANVTASSTYAADADATYEAQNLDDGMLDTLWCEGDKKGDGTGQWLSFAFDGPRTVTRLRIVNGNAFDAEQNATANQPAELELAFGDGTVETVRPAASPERQEFTFAPRRTERIVVTAKAVTKGSTYDDMCVAELVFVE